MTFRFEKFVSLMMLCIIALSVFSCSKYKGFKKADTGYYYNIHVKSDTGLQMQLGDWPELSMEFRIGDSLIWAYHDLFAVDTIIYEGDLNTALLTLRQGDSATFIFDKDQFSESYMGEKLDFPEEEIYISVKIYDIRPKAEVQAFFKKMETAYHNEPILTMEYLVENNWDLEPNTMGIYYKQIKKGKGETPSMNDMVTFNFAEKLLDGSVLTTSEGRDPVTIQLGVSRVITGWNMALSMMTKGEIAEFVIPSRFAYGDMEFPNMPPFSPIHVTIELTDITKSPEGGFQYK